MKIFYFILFAIATCIVAASGQSSKVVFNPFFRGNNFFSSAYEEKNFMAFEGKMPTDALAFFTSFDANAGNVTYNQANAIIKIEASYLVKRRIKNNIRFLKKIFEHVHKVYLKKYHTYSLFSHLIQNQSYDCLTGTALYAMVLDEMGITYELYETANHAYLIVNLGKEKVLFESTDPINGFIADAAQIEATQQRYAMEIPTNFNHLLGMVGHKSKPFTTLKVYTEKVNLIEFAGLYYYNQAVVYYNLKKYKNAVNTLEKAYTLYPSKRIINLLLVAIQEVLKEDLDKYELKKYIAKTKFYTMQGQGYFD